MPDHVQDVFEYNINREAKKIQHWLLDEAQSGYGNPADADSIALNTYDKTALTLLHTRRRSALIALRNKDNEQEKEVEYAKHLALLRGVGVENGPIVTFQDGTVISGCTPYTGTPFVIILPNPSAEVTYAFTFTNPSAVSSSAGKIAVWGDTVHTGWDVTHEVTSTSTIMRMRNITRFSASRYRTNTFTARNLIGPSRLLVQFKQSPTS